MRDFCKSSKSKSATAKSTTSHYSSWLWLPVVLLLSAALFFSVYHFWLTQRQQNSSQRILLYHQGQPVAVVHLWPAERQIFVADVTQLAWADPEQPASNLQFFYSFALNIWFDRLIVVDSLVLDQESIASALQMESDLETLIKDNRVWWRFEEWSKLQKRRQATNFHCPLAVINAAQTAGLAGRVSAILESSSFTVVRKDNYPEPQATTQLFYDADDLVCQELVTALAHWAGVEALPVTASDEILATYRSSMTLILGEDLAIFVDLAEI